MKSDALPLLSRVADSVYWVGRYIERAENVARFIGVNLNLQIDLPLAPAHQWQPLIDASGDTEAFRERYGDATQLRVIEYLAYDTGNPNSIASCLRLARENARSVRETISSEMWAQVNSMYLQIQTQRSLPEPERMLDAFRDIRMGCHLFQGIADATMSHNEAWHFMRLGRKLERADKTSRLLDVKYFMLLPSASDVGTPYDDLHWSAVLKSVSGFEMYRKKFGHITPADVVEFLVMDEEFPRSVHYCIRGASDSLQAITGTPAGAFRYQSEELMGQLRAELDFTSVHNVIRSGLHEYLDGLQYKMNAIDESLRDDFAMAVPQIQTETPPPSQSQAGPQPPDTTPDSGFVTAQP
ncbi:MAG: alpha-E domain-containing protein [Vicinamibacterales bacterium]|nr:alpha-E domain-containing protein [Vicinamibacterales bacterium]